MESHSNTKPSVISLLYNLGHKVIITGNRGWEQKLLLGGKALAYLVEKKGLGWVPSVGGGFFVCLFLFYFLKKTA